jgi:hypothetical protein
LQEADLTPWRPSTGFGTREEEVADNAKVALALLAILAMFGIAGTCDMQDMEDYRREAVAHQRWYAEHGIVRAMPEWVSGD